MKATYYSKILLTIVISVSITSLSAMQHVSVLKDLLLTQEAGTVLTTAALQGCCYASAWGLQELVNKKDGLPKQYIKGTGKIALSTLKSMMITGVLYGIARVFAEKYGSWPQADSLKPFLVGLTLASAASIYKGYSGKNAATILKKSKSAAWDVLGWLPYCVLSASLWTSLNRYRMS